MHFKAIANPSIRWTSTFSSCVLPCFAGSFQQKKNLCSISFEFIAIINRAIELKSIPKFPRDTRTHHCWQKRCSLRKSNQSNMNIKIPFFVRIRILDTHSSSLCLLPDIFFFRGMYRLCVRVCGCATRSGSLYQISHYIPNKSDFDFLRGNIFWDFFSSFSNVRAYSDSQW